MRVIYINLAIDQMLVLIILEIFFYQTFKVINIDSSIDYLDIIYKLYITNFFLPNFRNFEYKFSNKLVIRLSISIIHFIVLAI